MFSWFFYCILTLSTRSDDHYYQIQLERSRAFAEKETLEKVYQQLLEEHRKLQTNFVSNFLLTKPVLDQCIFIKDDTTAERDETNSHLRDLRRQLDDRRHEKSDGIMRAEIDRLRADLWVTCRPCYRIAKIELNFSKAKDRGELGDSRSG